MTNAGQCPLYGALLIRYWRTHTHSTFEFGAGVVSQVAVVHCIHFEVCVCVFTLSPGSHSMFGVKASRTKERTNERTNTHSHTTQHTNERVRTNGAGAIHMLSFSFRSFRVVQYSMLLADRVRPIGRTIDRCSIHEFACLFIAQARTFSFASFRSVVFLVLVYLLPPNGQERTRARPPNCAQLYKWLCVSPGRNDSGQIYWQMPTAK